MTMAATITATIIIIRLPKWKWITLLFSTVPIAMLSNMIRIVATGWCYYMITGPKAKEWAHDVSGLLMMPLALLLVWLELQLLSWLVPERTKSGDLRADLRLMSSVNSVGDIPRTGQGLFIVAVVDHVLYFRVFDDDGDLVVDTNEKRLLAQSQQIADLRKELESLWPLEKLAKSEKVRVIAAVTSIVQHTRTEDQRVILPVLYDKTAGEKASGKDKQKNTDLDELPQSKPKPKPKNDARKVILPALYDNTSGKKKQQNTDLDKLA